MIHLTTKGFLKTQRSFTIINWCLTDYTVKKKVVSLLQNEPLHKVMWSWAFCERQATPGGESEHTTCHIFSTSCVMLPSAALLWPCKYTFICNHRFSWQASQLQHCSNLLHHCRMLEVLSRKGMPPLLTPLSSQPFSHTSKGNDTHGNSKPHTEAWLKASTRKTWASSCDNCTQPW